MTAAHVKILDKEAVSNMSYFGAFNSMFVHFHFYNTHVPACKSLHDLDFRNNTLRHVQHDVAMYGHSTLPIFSSTCILKFIYRFNMHNTCILSTEPLSPSTKLVYHT